MKVFIATGMYRYENFNFLPARQSIWYIDSQIQGKRFLIVLKRVNVGRRKFLFLYPLSEKISGPMSSKVDVMKFLQYIMTWYMQPSQLGKKSDSKFLPSIFASSKAFRWPKFSCLFLLAARVHGWIILHSYGEKHIFGKKDILLTNCI